VSDVTIDLRTAVAALVKIVEDYVSERRRPGGGYDLPEGLCLQVHPRVHRLIQQQWVSDYDRFTSGRQWPLPAEVPVTVSPELPDGGWRLAVVTTEVINGGIMPPGTYWIDP
jgi:hypothetical protein